LLPLPFCKWPGYKWKLRGLGHDERFSVTYPKQVDLLEPIDMVEHLDKIELYLGQVCAIAGISKMQLD
jgi:hypothetical protein